MEIRAALSGDFDALGALTVAAYRALMEEPLGEYERELRDVAGRAAHSTVLVAVDDDGTVLGGVTYVPDAENAMSEFDDRDAGGIRMLAVAPRRQGAGIGRALVLECIGLARATGRARVVLHSTKYMVVAQELYRSLGFVRAPGDDVAITDEPYSEAEPFLLVAYVLSL